MSTPLPKAFELIKTSVNDALTFQKDLWKLNLISFFGPILMALLGGAAVAGLFFTNGFSLVGALLLLVVLAVVFVLSIWYGAHYMLTTLRLTKGDHQPVAPKASFEKVPSTVLVAILQLLAVLALPLVSIVILGLGSLSAFLSNPSTEAAARALGVGLGLGGLLLMLVTFIVTIYLAVRLQLSTLSLLDAGKRGADALRHSWMLTKGRFWSLAWRELVFLFFYYIATFVIVIVLSILGKISAWLPIILNAAVLSFVLLPVTMFFQTRVYKAFAAAGPETQA
jgi:hypothetical protein